MLTLKTIDKIEGRSISTVKPIEAATLFASEWVKGGKLKRFRPYPGVSLGGSFEIENDPYTAVYEVYWDNRDRCYVVIDRNAE